MSFVTSPTEVRGRIGAFPIAPGVRIVFPSIRAGPSVTFSQQSGWAMGLLGTSPLNLEKMRSQGTPCLLFLLITFYLFILSAYCFRTIVLLSLPVNMLQSEASCVGVSCL